MLIYTVYSIFIIVLTKTNLLSLACQMRLLCFPRVLKNLAFFSAQLYMKKKMMNSDFTSVSNELIFFIMNFY